jgi:Septum formation
MRRLLGALAAITAAMTLGACSWFGGGGKHSPSQPVLTVTVGQCFAAPTSVHKELTSLKRTPCTQPHALEAYARVPYTTQENIADLAYPSSDTLTKFAQSACAQQFKDYVGIDYLDSNLFFTFLLPSPQGWEQNLDRFVLCFIESNKSLRTASAKGKKE